jgi:hypothetical protein
MKTIVSFALPAVVAVIMLATGLAVGAPIAHAAECQNGAISPPTEYGTYSLCIDGQWQYVDRLLCIDHPDSPYCTAATPAPASSSPASPAPVTPPPVVAPPPVGIGVDTPNVPYIPAPSVNVPNMGCTWVNSYTRKDGTRVRGYWRC